MNAVFRSVVLTVLLVNARLISLLARLVAYTGRSPAVATCRRWIFCRTVAMSRAVMLGVGMASVAMISLLTPSAAHAELPYGPDTSRPGYVWRGAFPHDQGVDGQAATWRVASANTQMQTNAPPTVIASPDNKYEAVLVANGKNKHYHMRQRSSGHTVFITHARFKKTPSDVKGAAFSEDGQKFAAIYHYGHKGPQTWIGVWWVTTGLFDLSWTYDGYLRTIPAQVFGRASQPAQPAELVITGHWVVPAFLKAGQPFNYEVNFVNAGGKATGAYEVRFFIDERPYQDSEKTALGAGESTKASGIFPQGLPAGDHTLSVCLDIDNVVVESDEQNNCTLYGVKVSEP